MTARHHRVLNGTTKYNNALERGTSIADTMSRNGTRVFGEMMEALEKFEGVVKDGVAPFVERVDIEPLPQLLLLTFSFDNDDTTRGDTITRASFSTVRSKYDHSDASSDEQPSTQSAAITKETQTHPDTEQVVLLYLQSLSRKCYVPPVTGMASGWAPFMENRMVGNRAQPSGIIPAVRLTHLDSSSYLRAPKAEGAQS
ncbi:hypothetical protein F441_14553 [Phytophthora nicotianae CJ01A1]|uniref:Uncharacterized protein n=3 Tax=Phytophthora nicotianae TaxID=4792 RepID=W2YRT3_PHYNI|nr:hypothetical protein L915_14315 [Phytophthora nicotianae]ETP09567.1 hypothetical protein F441_14553 [Phytophthora nicotianae CJ01A1]ETP37666.1 hypothetical protein F442_14512 [Phytophthora nicotianae P10297]